MFTRKSALKSAGHIVWRQFGHVPQALITASRSSMFTTLLSVASPGIVGVASMIVAATAPDDAGDHVQGMPLQIGMMPVPVDAQFHTPSRPPMALDSATIQ